MSTYVVSDLHGEYGILERGLKEINFSSSDHLYCIGDAIDRGHEGIQILQEIKSRKNMELLLGNHEQMMLSSVDPNGKPECNGEDSELWLNWNGGKATFGKYRALSDDKDRKELLFWLNRRELIKTLEVSSADGRQKYTLCHSYYIPEYDALPYFKIPKKSSWDIVWRSIFRDDYETMAADVYSEHTDRLFVTGHVPVQRIMYENDKDYDPKETIPQAYHWKNLINIDGGLAFQHNGIRNGAIFFRLEDQAEFFVEYKL
ncbi:MAG: metallophosphoesterase [Lachnospiraceae bacterium]|nr:metallophosphoesterase [Lachnospiraceae bacterium]